MSNEVATPTPRLPFGQRRSVGMTVGLLGLGSLWIYGCSAFVHGERFLGRSVGKLGTWVLLVLGLVVTWWVLRALLRRGPATVGTLTRIGLSCFVLAATLLVADLAFALYSNWSSAKAAEVMSFRERREDRNLWHGEIYPEFYYPTERTFSLFKPNITISAQTYGEFYHPDLLRSELVAKSVLERKTVTYRIGPLGLRDTTPLSKARIYALGDSFAMGFGSDEGQTWTARLSEALGEPVYNMGISATGPGKQFMLLEYILQTQKEDVKVDRVLWMLFEGNDLENDFTELRNRQTTGATAGVTEGTLLGHFLTIPTILKDNSILGRAIRGTLRRPAGPGDEYLADGVPSHFPLYHSKRFGYRLFNPHDIERAQKPLEYVLEHPNWPRMRATFRKMKELAAQRSFQVTVVLAPSAARLYGPAFEDCPKVSSEPHLLNRLAMLARESGFDVIDLFEAMKPPAEKELLYYRDDHHWNVRGNAVVADIIRQRLGR